jgi:hypothetical protein
VTRKIERGKVCDKQKKEKKLIDRSYVRRFESEKSYIDEKSRKYLEEKKSFIFFIREK